MTRLRLTGYTARFLHGFEYPIWLSTIASFGYFLWSEHRFDWHSGQHVAALLLSGLLAAFALLIRSARKRMSAGIFRFRTSHESKHALHYLCDVERDYLYVGQSFESMLKQLPIAMGHGGMARGAALRLLLADPDDPDQMAFLSSIDHARRTADEVRRDLIGRLGRTVESLKGDHRVSIKKHREALRGWIHIFDDEVIVFGMLPADSSGARAPALEIERLAHHWALFEHFEKWAEDLWNKSVAVKDPAQWVQQLKQSCNHSDPPEVGTSSASGR